MSYATPSDAPSYVPEAKRPQWIQVWSHSYKSSLKKGMPAKDAETSAFKQANGVTMPELDYDALLATVPAEVVELADRAQCGVDSKSVGGTCVPRGKFLIVGDAKDKASWRLPLHTASHIQSALSRFNQTQGTTPNDARRLARIAKIAGIKVDKFRKHLSETHWAPSVLDAVFNDSLCVLNLADFPTIQHSDGTRLVPLAVAVTGSWVKGDHSFSITRADLLTMMANFGKRENQQVSTDFEHASELGPEVSKGDAIPASGYIHSLTLDKDSKVPNRFVLWANWEPTPEAEQLIKDKKYRFFSPAIDFAATDKKTGEPQGATLTSGALTNRPFLDELPPITLTEELMENQKNLRVLLAEGVAEKESPAKDTPADAAGEPLVKHVHVHLKKSDDGKMCYADDGTGKILGEVGMAEILSFAKENCAEAESDPDDPNEPNEPAETEEQTVQAALGAGSMILTDIKLRFDKGCNMADKDARGKSITLLTEKTISKEGGFDSEQAELMCENGQVDYKHLLSFQRANRQVDGAIKEGKILPRQRKFYLTEALERPEEFRELVGTMKPQLILGEHGLAGSTEGNNSASVQAELDLKIKEYKKDHPGSKHAAAMRAVLATDRDLSKRYDDEAQGKRVQ